MYSQTNAGLSLGTTAGTGYEGSAVAALDTAGTNIQNVIPNDAASDNKLLATSALAGVTFTTVSDDIYINW